MIFWATMYSFCFCLFLFILISSWVKIKCCCCCCCAPPTSLKVNTWISYKCWHFQLVMSIDLVKLYSILVTGFLKVAKITIYFDIICLLTYSRVADSSTKYCKISCLHIELLLILQHFVTTLPWPPGNIVYTSTTDSYDDLMCLYFYFL